jgi:hypothetical protein
VGVDGVQHSLLGQRAHLPKRAAGPAGQQAAVDSAPEGRPAGRAVCVDVGHEGAGVEAVGVADAQSVAQQSTRA